MSPSRVDNLVVGAGPAGLAVAACLRRRGASFEVLERAAEVGSSWRTHYERLHLHTAASHSHLPYREFPDIYPTYPSRQQIVDYLADYAREFDVRPHFGATVQRASPVGDTWRVETARGDWTAKRLIVATGYNGHPMVPEFDGQAGFAGPIVHSKAYFSGREFAGKRVMVVGSGNSGAEIAVDLFECGATPFICIRGPVHVNARDFMGIPAQVLSLRLSKLPRWVADRIGVAASKMRYPDLEALGIRRPSKGPISMIVEDGRIPMIDIGTIDLIRQGALTVVPGITSFDREGAHFVDGRYVELDAVVLATGYRSGLGDWLETDALDDHGLPRVFGAPAAPGLFFIGFRNPPTGALRDIGQEAQALADHIAKAN